PDGSRLAFFQLDARSGAYEPVIWERESGRLTTVRVPAGKYVAENSELRWCEDGRKIFFNLHTVAWRKAVQDSFAVMTKGPVFVQSSTEPFLSWDALRRMANVRNVVSYEVANGSLTEVLPETMVAVWNVTKDGATLTYNEDITKKTDYDVIFGTENKLMSRPVSCAAAASCTSRALMPTLKGVTIVWAEDGSRY